MKKNWNNPELKALELNETNDELECADQSDVMTLDGNCTWKCHHNPSPQSNGRCDYRKFNGCKFICTYNPIKVS